MRAYRHWKAEYASMLTERGRVRVMPLSYYRKIETARPGVQDIFESSSIGTHRPAVISMETAGTREQAVLSALGIKLGKGAVALAIENRTLIQGPDAYIFCLTSEPTTALFDPADVVTEIPDLKVFAYALLQGAKGRFERFEAGPVKYQNITYSLEDGSPAASPFVKRPEFAHQKEIRIVLYPAGPISGEVYIESPLLIKALAQNAAK